MFSYVLYLIASKAHSYFQLNILMYSYIYTPLYIYQKTPSKAFSVDQRVISLLDPLKNRGERKIYQQVISILIPELRHYDPLSAVLCPKHLCAIHPSPFGTFSVLLGLFSHRRLSEGNERYAHGYFQGFHGLFRPSMMKGVYLWASLYPLRTFWALWRQIMI